MAKITLAKDTDKQALKDFYLTAMTVLNQIQTDANTLQTTSLNTTAKCEVAIKKIGKSTGDLAQGLEILLKGLKRGLYG